MLAGRFRGEFGFVVDRVNSYSFDPMVVSSLLEDLHPLKGIATVNYRRSSARSRHFIPLGLPLRSFASLIEAVDWLELPRSDCETLGSKDVTELHSNVSERKPSPRQISR